MQKENQELVELLAKLEKINEEAQEELRGRSLENRKMENLILGYQQVVVQEALQIQECRDRFPKLFGEGRSNKAQSWRKWQTKGVLRVKVKSRKQSKSITHYAK
jgi:hypothetical protein